MHLAGDIECVFSGIVLTRLPCINIALIIIIIIIIISFAYGGLPFHSL